MTVLGHGESGVGSDDTSCGGTCDHTHTWSCPEMEWSGWLILPETSWWFGRTRFHSAIAFFPPEIHLSLPVS